jgi:hypothetical protein
VKFQIHPEHQKNELKVQASTTLGGKTIVWKDAVDTKTFDESPKKHIAQIEASEQVFTGAEAS